MAENIAEISDDSFQKDVIDQQTPVLVDFWAPWCGPCRAIGPVVEELANVYGKQMQFKKCNVDDNPLTPGKFGIKSIPTLIFFKEGKVVEQIVETLEVYPRVKGIQIMNDMGNYMFSRYRGQWIPDTEGRRKVIMQNLRNWNVFSNSSPVEGITTAIKTFYDPNKKISIYVFGDEFTGNSIAQVVDTVDRINREDADGNRRVRIHGVGFPVQFIRAPHLQTTGIRFATLMRELTYRNGGSFVGLNDFRP